MSESSTHVFLPETPPRASWRRFTFVFYALFFLLVLMRSITELGYGAVVLPGDPTGDLARYFYFARAFLGQSLRDRDLPLWNPWIMGGIPFAGSIQSAVFYPWNWLHAFLQTPHAIVLTLWAHLTLGAWGMERLARRLGASHGAAAFGAIAFGASGFVGAHLYAGHLTYITAIPWAPFALWAYEIARTRRPVAWGAVAGFFIALQILAGAPQIAWLTLLSIVILVIVRVAPILIRREARSIAAGCKPLATCILFAAGIGAVQILPAMPFLRESFRTLPVDPRELASGAWPVENLVQFLFPQFWGSFESSAYWGQGLPWEVFAPIGIVALAVGAAAFRRDAPHKGAAFAYAGLGIVGLILAPGAGSPVYRALAFVIPAFDTFQAPGRHLFLWTLGASAIAALGWNSLFASGAGALEFRRRWSHACLKAAAAIALLLGVLFAARGSDSDAWIRLLRWENARPNIVSVDANRSADSAEWRRTTFRSAIADASASVAALVLAAGIVALGVRQANQRLPFGAERFVVMALQTAGLLWVFWGATAPAPIDRELWDEKIASQLRESGQRAALGAKTESLRFSANHAMLLGVPALWGYEPGAPLRYTQWINASQGISTQRLRPFQGVDFINSMTNIAGAHWLVMANGEAPRDSGWKLLTEGARQSIYENAAAMPRAWIAPAARELQSWDALMLLMATGWDDAANTVLLVGDAPDSPVAPQTEPPVVDVVRITSHSNDEVTVRYTGSRGGYLILADRASGGWRAKVEGKATPILEAFGIFRAVVVPAGDGDVVFEYKPWQVPAGIAMSLASVIALIGLLLLRGRSD